MLPRFVLRHSINIFFITEYSILYNIFTTFISIIAALYRGMEGIRESKGKGDAFAFIFFKVEIKNSVLILLSGLEHFNAISIHSSR